MGNCVYPTIDDMDKILGRLIEHGVKLRADKCVFFQKEVRYLGRLISENGYRPDAKDTIALEKFRDAPKTIGELRGLLGFFGYYRCYVENINLKMRPLYSLLKNVEPPDPKSKKKKNAAKSNANKNQPIKWNENLQKIVNDMIDFLKSPEIIAFPDFEKSKENPFFVTCDASQDGLGAVLLPKTKRYKPRHQLCVTNPFRC